MKLNKYKLKELADVDISGVDKKTKPHETQVSLCNFVDVYYKWAVTKDMESDFMIATANHNEIERFRIKKGQVALTKDSETRDDIGVSTYIADDFSNTVLGYHNALVSPHKDKLDGKYLNAYLHTKMAQTYFSNNASGSGQRFSLSIDVLKDFQIYIPSISEQKQIGEIFSLIDRKINLNRAINRNLEAMAKKLYDYWFVQFDFPNAEGKPYKSSGGKMVYNEVLKREIPEGWEVKKISDFVYLSKATINPFENPHIIYCHYSIPGFDNTGSFVEEKGTAILSSKYAVKSGDIMVSKLNPWTNRVALATTRENQICSTEFVVWCLKKKKSKGFLWALAKNKSFIDYTIANTSSTSHSHARISPQNMVSYKVACCEKYIEQFSLLTNHYCDLLSQNIQQIQYLTTIRNRLLPLLMNGQVEVL